MITDFGELFERFSIMTIDGKLSDEDALRILQKCTIPSVFNMLKAYLNRKK